VSSLAAVKNALDVIGRVVGEGEREWRRVCVKLGRVDVRFKKGDVENWVKTVKDLQLS
jgi:hypothetical protein